MIKFLLIFNVFFIYSTHVLSLDVNETIKSTVENNIKIKIGLEEINESKELIESAYGSYKPDISLKLTEKQSTTETTTSTSTTTTNKLADTYSLTVTQNLYDGGNNSIEVEKSKILFDKQVESFYITLNQLILSAIKGYLNVQLYEKSLDVTKKNYEVIKKLYEDTLSKKNLGISTLSDLKFAESSYEIAKSNLLIAEGDLEIGKKTFKQIVGLDPINLQEFVNLEKSFNYEDLFNSAIKYNHDLKLLVYDYEVAKIDLQIQKNDKLPTLDLTGEVAYNDSVSTKGTETTSGSISATLTIPIYQQGIEYSNIRKYESKLIQAQYKIDDKKEDIRINCLMFINNYNVYKSQLESSKFQIDANITNLKVIEKEYETGIKTFNELIDQEEKLLDAYLYSFNKNKDLLISYFEILALEGKLIEVFNDFLPEL